MTQPVTAYRSFQIPQTPTIDSGRNARLVRHHNNKSSQSPSSSGSSSLSSSPSSSSGFPSPTLSPANRVRSISTSTPPRRRSPSPMDLTDSPSHKIKKSQSSDLDLSTSISSEASFWLEGKMIAGQVFLQDEVDTKLESSIIQRNEEITTKVFDSLTAKATDEVALRTLMQKFPKGEHHAHLTGSNFSNIYLNYAQDACLFVDSTDLRFYESEAKERVAVREVFSEPKYAELRKRIEDRIDMNGCENTSGNRKTEHFFNSFNIIESIALHMPLELQIIHVVKNAMNDSVKYLELMYEPKIEDLYLELPKGYEEFVTAGNYERALHVLIKSGWLTKYVEKNSPILNKCCKNVAEILELPVASIAEIDSPVTVRFQIEIMRVHPPQPNRTEFNAISSNAKFFASVAAAMAFNEKNPDLILAMNRVGPEHDADAMKNFDRQNEIIVYLRKYYNDKIKFSDHAGELTVKLASPDVLAKRMSDSAAISDRIGHGNTIDKDTGNALKLLKQGKCIDICITSNENILGSNISTHVIHFYLKSKIPFTINTDDAGVTRSSLTDEYIKAIKACNLTYRNLKDIVRNTGEYSHLDGESIFISGMNMSKRYVLKPEFEQLHSIHWNPGKSVSKRIKQSEKMQLQIKLERAFAQFEQEVAMQRDIGLSLSLG